MNLLHSVAEQGDENDYTLTKTWQAARYIIAVHIRQANAAKDKRQSAYTQLKQYIEQNYLHARRS